MTQIMLAISQNQIFVSLFIAMVLGMILGVERFAAHKAAGMRTYTLISLGSALFIIISRLTTAAYGSISPSGAGYDFHVIAQIIAAAGFLGVGAIFHKADNQVSGITTASGLWVAAGIGIACGFELYRLAALVTGLALFTFVVLWFIEKQIGKLSIAHRADMDDEMHS
jgi:putative Mg2+ transporter-C (MgtC) family protein